RLGLVSLALPVLFLVCVASLAVSASNRSAFQVRAVEAASSPLFYTPVQPTPAALGPGIEPPILISRIEAEYPEAARRPGVTGVVRVRFVVMASGGVESVGVEGSGNQDLEVAAIAAVSQWKYRPAIRTGQRVPVELIEEIRFPR